MEQRPHYIPERSWIDDERALQTSEAARYCGCSESYLNKLRLFGGGPSFCRVGGRLVRYRRQDLDDWLNSRRYASTSEYVAA